MDARARRGGSLHALSSAAEAGSCSERLTLNCRNTRPIARQTAIVSNAKHRVKARIDGRPAPFHPYHGRSGWLKELERLITDLRRDNVPPGRISVLLRRVPRAAPTDLRRFAALDGPPSRT
jgi:hypothetical protein